MEVRLYVSFRAGRRLCVENTLIEPPISLASAPLTKAKPIVTFLIALQRVCLNVAGRDSRVEVAGAGAGNVRGCG